MGKYVYFRGTLGKYVYFRGTWGKYVFFQRYMGKIRLFQRNMGQYVYFRGTRAKYVYFRDTGGKKDYSRGTRAKYGITTAFLSRRDHVIKGCVNFRGSGENSFISREQNIKSIISMKLNQIRRASREECVIKKNIILFIKTYVVVLLSNQNKCFNKRIRNYFQFKLK